VSFEDTIKRIRPERMQDVSKKGFTTSKTEEKQCIKTITCEKRQK
jgi:hypothetical protein